MENDTFLYHFPPDRYPLDLCDRMFSDPHTLIGGTTGSGKSVLINDFIYNIIATRTFDANDPEGVNFIFIDPKAVELYQYIELPFCIGYASENDKIIDYLERVVIVMERRYNKMREKGLKKYDGCYIVVIIDELADLMTTCKKEVMPLLQRIAQLGRAAKIKLVAATQAPNRKVIPAELILNFTGRVALRCLSPIESRQIINTDGAEDLPKHGKCLYRNNNGDLSQENIFMVPEADIINTINFITEQTKGTALKDYIESKKQQSNKATKDSDAAWIITGIITLIAAFFLIVFFFS